MKKGFLQLLSAVIMTAMLLPMWGGIWAKEEEGILASADDDLPEVHITTDSGKAVTKKVYEGATLSMTLPDSFSEYTSTYTTQNGGKIQMRCRGNSTYETGENRLGSSGKFSYKIKLDSKADLLGMGESRHWVLIANFYDVTNLRNKLAYDLSGAMGLTYTQSRWVVVYLNGEYQGLYTLCESIRIDEDRVDITDWEERAETLAARIAAKEGLPKAMEEKLATGLENDLSWVTTGKFGEYNIAEYCDMEELNIDSGYLLEYDMRQDGDTSKFTTSSGVKIQLDSPTALDTNPEMFGYVTGLLERMEEALWSDTFCTNDGVHYSEFVDMQSLVDYFILFNLFKNIEFGHLSIFLYIEDGMIYFGPAWDFDGGSGNQVTLWEDWMDPEQWFYMDGRAAWWKELCGDPYFVTRVEERWQEIRPLVDLYLESLPQWKAYIEEEAEMNFSHFGAPKNWYIGGVCESFDQEYDTLVEWMDRRIAWLDAQWSLRDPNMEGYGLESSDRLFLHLRYANGDQLAKDLLTVSGAAADKLYDLSREDDLKFLVSTQHTTHQKMFVYVNGKYLTETPLDLSTSAEVTIPRKMLDTRPGAVNVIYMVGFNGTNYYRASYMTVRMAETVPTGVQCVIRAGDTYIVTEKNETVTLPEINVHADGFTALGWTDGENLYPAGTEVSTTRSVYLWIDWERTDLLTEFHLKEGKEQTVLTPTPIAPGNNPQGASGKDSCLWVLLIVLPVAGAGVACGVWYVQKRKKKSA